MTAEGPSRATALLVVDLQNDFLHDDGSYARGGVDASPLREATDNARLLMEGATAFSIPIVTTHFTIHRDAGGVPMVSPHLAKLRPFLREGDFESGTWGHSLLDALPSGAFAVDKVAYSAFANTPLEWWLGRNGLTDLVICGIVSNGGVASTARDAHVRDFSVTVVSDASAAFDGDVHDATMTSLGSVVDVASSTEILDRWR